MPNEIPTEVEHLLLNVVAKVAQQKTLTLRDEVALRDWVSRFTPLATPEPGFPERPEGDVRERNNLRRTNWFNGRYLTAEALSRQDVYFDARARLNAQALMPGIAWGLGIVGENGETVNRWGPGNGSLTSSWLRKSGFPANGDLTLSRGLAFDGVGRPILVSREFRFNLAALAGEWHKTPRRVVAGRTEFMPCVCLAPDPNGPTAGSQQLPTGPYLLVIEAGEVPDGWAKVTGELCGGRRTSTCEADSWQGTFGLSLVRFPVDLPLRDDLNSFWSLRGTLSAYYFDVFEHGLWRRWDPPFPRGDRFVRDTGAGRHEGMATPLAMVYLGEDGSALFLDTWIPRRTICATPAEDWHRTRFGAPPRAAAWARIHQFQTMLHESLGHLSMLPRGLKDRSPSKDLYSRGFRHIPPIGFLPLETGEHQEEEQNIYCIGFESVDLGEDHTTRNPFVTFDSRGNQDLKFTLTYPDPQGELTSASFHPVGGTQKKELICNSATCCIELTSPSHAVELGLKFDRNTQVHVEAFAENLQSVSSTIAVTESESAVEVAVRLESSTPAENAIKRVVVTPRARTIWNLVRFCYAIPKAPRQDGTLHAHSSRTGQLREALRQGEAYFANTNVVIYGVAALHDDDILEDLHNVIDKDPVQLQLADRPGNRSLREPIRSLLSSDPTSSQLIEAVFFQSAALFAKPGFEANKKLAAFLAGLGELLHAKSLEIDALVNRRAEVVKLIVPLQGLRRLHPLLGELREDALSQAAAWGLEQPPNFQAAALVGAQQQSAIHSVPRHFVVYVRQRLVLSDLMLRLLAILNSVAKLTSRPQIAPIVNHLTASFIDGRTAVAVREDFASNVSRLSAENQAFLRSAMALPEVQELVVPILAASMPSLNDQHRRSILISEARAAVEENPENLAAVLDRWALDFNDIAPLKLMAAIQQPERTIAMLEAIDQLPRLVTPAMVRNTLNISPHRFESETSTALYAEVMPRLEERTLVEIMGSNTPENIDASLTFGDVLARTPEEAAELVGGDQALGQVLTAFLDSRSEVITAAEGLAVEVPPEIVSRLEGELSSATTPSEILTALKNEEDARSEQDRNRGLIANIERANTLLRLGGNRREILNPLLRRPRG